MLFTTTMSYNNFQNLGVLFVVLTVSVYIKDVAAKPPSKIISGDYTTIEEFPSIVSIRFFKIHRCGGVLISNKHVLTAAHCVVIQFPNSRHYHHVVLKKELEVYTGTNSSSLSDDEHRHEVENIHVHPEYTGNETDDIKHDIAVITLTKAIEPSPTQRYIQLAPANPPTGASGYVAGWGFTSENGRLSENLKKLRVVMRSKLACSLPAGEICASRNKGEGPTKADSGGPFYIDNYLAGIVVRTYGSEAESPDIYTNVFHYRPWIHRIIFDL